MGGFSILVNIVALARAVEQRKGNFMPGDIANTAWAFAAAGQADAPLFVALARVAECWLGSFSSQNLARTAWAFASAG